MTFAPQPVSTMRNGFLILLAGSFLFAVAHTQAPLYSPIRTSTACTDSLPAEWDFSTAIGWPTRSTRRPSLALVAFTQRCLDVVFFQVVLFILIVIYFASLMAIGCLLIPAGPRRSYFLPHWESSLQSCIRESSAGRRCNSSVSIIPWYFQCGMAGQYVLGPDLQPSAFGVLLVSSVAAFAYGRPVLAIVCTTLACLMHATYLLPAAMLTLGYVYLLCAKANRAPQMFLGVGSFAAVLPVIVETALAFVPTSPEIFSSAQRLLAEFRIPHHAQVRRWFDLVAGLQIAWIALAVILYRKTKLAALLGIPAALSFVLTLIQLACRARHWRCCSLGESRRCSCPSPRRRFSPGSSADCPTFAGCGLPGLPRCCLRSWAESSWRSIDSAISTMRAS